MAFVDLELIVAALVVPVGAEIPSPFDFDRIACFVLPFELDDTLRGAGIRRPVMKGAFEKLAVADVDAILAVAARLGACPRDEDQAFPAKQAQRERLEEGRLAVLVRRHDENDVPAAVRARKLESRTAVGAPVDELNGTEVHYSSSLSNSAKISSKSAFIPRFLSFPL